MTEELLYKLISIVEEAAPQLWRIALRQTLVVGIQNLITVIITGVLGQYALRKALWMWRERTEDPEDVSDIIATVLAVGGFMMLVIAFGFLMDLIEIVFNPEFYAIKLLMDMAQR